MAGHRIKPSSILEALVYIIRDGAKLPATQSKEAAGYDICTPINFSISPGEMVIVPTGIVAQPPPGFHIELLPRSGLAIKHQIMFMNNVGLIDRDYAGESDEIHLMLYRAPITAIKKFNTNTEDWFENHEPPNLPVYFDKGERVGQLVFRATEFLKVVEVDKAPGKINRGGLGSTGR